MTENESKLREPLWSTHSKWRVRFYIVLSICGVAVSVFTLVDEWSKVVVVLTLADEWSKNCLAIFDVLWERVFGSAVLVWFVFQVTEAAMSAYQAFLDWRAERLKAAEEKGRKEERARVRKWIETGFRQQGLSDEEIQRVLKLMDALEKDSKD